MLQDFFYINMILFIGTTEVILIFLVVLLLFGSKKIPEVARALGKGVREFQKATAEIKREISKADLDADNLKDPKKNQMSSNDTPSSNPSENQ